MGKDLKQQVEELEKKVAEMQDILGTDKYGREQRVTGQFAIENTATFRMVPDDATTATNARYGEIYITGDNLTYIDSSGTVMTVTAT